MKVSLLGGKDTLDATRAGTKIFHGLNAPTQSLLVANWVQVRASHKRLVIITPSEERAWELEAELLLFLRVVEAPTTTIHVVEAPHSPYAKFLPSPQQRWERLQLLWQLSETATAAAITVVPIAALARRPPPREFWDSSLLSIKSGDSFDLLELEKKLAAIGYNKRELVEDPGTFSVRGEIVDVYSPQMPGPIRIEFFDQEVEKIRNFDLSTQRSSGEVLYECIIIAAREFSCSADSFYETRERVKIYCDQNGIPKANRDRLSELLAKGIITEEFDNLLPFFFTSLGSWSDYFKPEVDQFLVLEKENCQSNLETLLENAKSEHQRTLQEMRPLPYVNDLYSSWQDLTPLLHQKDSIFVSQLDLAVKIPDEQKHAIHSERITINKLSSAQDWIDFSHKLKDWLNAGNFVSCCANSVAQIDRLGFFFHQRKIPFVREAILPGKIGLWHGKIGHSFAIPQYHLIFLSEDDLFAQKRHSASRQERNPHTPKQETPQLRSLDALSVDDPVVHIDHGIALYKGIVSLNTASIRNDYVLLEYAGKDKLYLPVYRLDLLQRYVGVGGSHPSLDKLGAGQFQKTKQRVRESARDIAVDLLQLYAKRAKEKGFSFSPPNADFHAFAADFPYDETQDQERAIQETITDMCSSQPMDRLICGDVGFGKTEVALRAAMKACLDHKQVAVLVPTTILAEQHFRSFQSRFANYPLEIAAISRFRSRKEQAEILGKLKQGKLDIIIGTHRLLSKDISFHDLGLLIIDEEQRFGVEHKERIKQLKVNTDVLTLSATPLPRTLHLSLSGIRDISLIQTAPADRLPIRTTIAPYDQDIIRSAIESEIQRGGQAFFLHNKVQTIEESARQIREIVPKAKVAVAHAQMPEGQLEKVMMEFFQGKTDVLVTSAIIENGLDVQNANTIIIDRADHFGLSQLYQIRGRVGRSQRRAYAYLLIPESGKITEDARERLQILQRFNTLGSGYAIASYDLEMRGGGDMLGTAQSGHIAAIGYDLYIELLNEEIAKVKGQSTAKTAEVEIQCAFPALLPESFIPDSRTRLGLYKKLSSLESEEQLEDARIELLDRFGPLPEETNNLLAVLTIKLLLQRLGLKAIHMSKNGIILTAGPHTQLSHQELLNRVESNPQFYSFSPEGRLHLHSALSSATAALDALRKHLPGLSS